MIKCYVCGGSLAEKEVIYRVEWQGQLIVVENVPAKVCSQCGEKTYAPETVERLQQTVWGERTPKKTVQTPVFDFAEP